MNLISNLLINNLLFKKFCWHYYQQNFITKHEMKGLLQQRFFRLLSEYSQHEVSVSDLTEAIEELAIHLADSSMNEQDYSVLLRYFSFVLNRLKSYRLRFEQGEKCLIMAY